MAYEIERIVATNAESQFKELEGAALDTSGAVAGGQIDLWQRAHRQIHQSSATHTNALPPPIISKFQGQLKEPRVSQTSERVPRAQ